MGNKTVAIIPARGGSKRIPRKNIKEFCGVPIIYYSIHAALESQLFDEVMVSTDDEEVAKIALQMGAKVPFMRSSETANDFATTAEVITEVLIDYEKQQGKTFDYACCIYPTAPFIKMSDLSAGFELLVQQKFNSVFPITAFSYPILRSLKMDGQQRVTMNWPEYQTARDAA